MQRHREAYASRSPVALTRQAQPCDWRQPQGRAYNRGHESAADGRHEDRYVNSIDDKLPVGEAINPYESPRLPTSLDPEAGRSDLFWAVWAVTAAFGTYFCMYFFRKPFTAATFDGAIAFGLDFKKVLVVAQVLGYMFSKFIGIKVIAEMPRERRAWGIVVLIAVAELALLSFAVVPQPWNAACMFVNGLMLGMVFGLVLGFLEGRLLTESLAAGLCASFILAGGATKSVGTWLLARGVSEFWMPGVVGLMFLPPLGLGAWMLSRIPPPGVRDVEARTERAILNRAGRWSLFSRYAWGLSLIIAMYLAVTILRGIRDDFAPEIWLGLGTKPNSSIYTWSEMWVALGVLAVNGCAVLIRDNRRAFFAAIATAASGLVLLCVALVGRQMAMLGAFPFMVLVGLGLYLPYVAVHTTIFERLLAMTRDRGNIGFLMYVADSVGYLGYAAVVLARASSTAGSAAAEHNQQFAQFFVATCWLMSGLSLICLALTWRYFATRAAAPLPAVAVEGAA
jgi:hypothetical protein